MNEIPEISQQDRQLLLLAYHNDATVQRTLDAQGSLSVVISRLVTDKRLLIKQVADLHPGERIFIPEGEAVKVMLDERESLLAKVSGLESLLRNLSAERDGIDQLKIERDLAMKEAEGLKAMLSTHVGKGLLLFMGQVKPSKEMVQTDDGLLRWTGLLSGFVSAILADVSEERMEALIAKINDFGDGENPRPEWTAALCNFHHLGFLFPPVPGFQSQKGEGTPS